MPSLLLLSMRDFLAITRYIWTAEARAVVMASMYVPDWPIPIPPWRIPNTQTTIEPGSNLKRLCF